MPLSSPSGTALLFSYIFFSIELFTDMIMLAIACLNLAVIGPTKLLHANLKSILIIQSVSVLIFGVDRSAMLVQKLASNDPFGQANAILQIVLNFNAIFRRLLGHVLIIERLLATMRTNSYEKFSKYRFNMAWFAITFPIAFVNAATLGQSKMISKFNLITSIVSTGLSVAEYLLITIIGHYNQKKYSNQIENASHTNYNIGQRYQVSDNINTAKQLSATFLCFFLSNLLLALLYSAMAFEIVTEPYQINLVYTVANWAISILCVAIEFTIMTHHPLLKKRFANLLKKILCFNRVGSSKVEPNCANLAKPLENDENEMNEHFNMLQQLWNK